MTSRLVVYLWRAVFWVFLAGSVALAIDNRMIDSGWALLAAVLTFAHIRAVRENLELSEDKRRLKLALVRMRAVAKAPPKVRPVLAEPTVPLEPPDSLMREFVKHNPQERYRRSSTYGKEGQS